MDSQQSCRRGMSPVTGRTKRHVKRRKRKKTGKKEKNPKKDEFVYAKWQS
jgi:hypothetical protein